MTQSDLITSHIPLVHSIANRINVPSVKDDLVGEGTVALVKCADKFDPQKGTTFSTYARHRVRGAMLNYLRRNTNGTVSLDDRDENGVPYHATVGSDGQADRAMLRDDFSYYLHPVEEWVIVKRYFEKMRIDDIATELGFQVSRVSQIHSNALNKLKRAFAPTEDIPQEEDRDHNYMDRLLQVVRKMMWDEWGVEVYEI